MSFIKYNDKFSLAEKSIHKVGDCVELCENICTDCGFFEEGTQLIITDVIPSLCKGKQDIDFSYELSDINGNEIKLNTDTSFHNITYEARRDKEFKATERNSWLKLLLGFFCSFLILAAVLYFAVIVLPSRYNYSIGALLPCCYIFLCAFFMYYLTSDR